MPVKGEKIILIISGLVAIGCFLLLAANFILTETFANRVYPGVYLNDINLGGLNRSQFEETLNRSINRFEQDGVKIRLKDREVIWHNIDSLLGPELASQPLIFDLETTWNKAYALGRTSGHKVFFKFKTLFSKTPITLDFSVKDEELLKILKDNFFDLEIPANNARLNYRLEGEDNFFFFIEPENSGREIDRDHFLSELKDNLSQLKNDTIELILEEKKPTISRDQAQGLEAEAENLLDLAPFNLLYQDQNLSLAVSKEVWASCLDLESEAGVQVGLALEEIKRFFDEKVKTIINREPLLPKIEFENDRVSSFSPGKDGLKLNYEKSIDNIQEAFVRRDMSEVVLVVEIDEVPKIDSINDLGIEKIIGTGHSNFSGSSVNRRYNIRVGADKLSGLIIKPGEEFSLLKALGDTDAAAGYRPELVIKGNKTELEYGGGLCQIATTIFRTALGSGLPITERRNHSYRVSYYEPAGTDATIYNPSPDLKFKNDTGGNILIQARFEGDNDIYFDFWGKPDGRIATTTYPIIYNIVPPAPTKIIETTQLPVGQKKCTESAHNGAQAYFDYIVIYNSGHENEQRVESRISSKYVPWQAVCLVGVEEKDSDLEEASASTTVPIE